MKNISVTDLMLVPELSHLRMIDFINPDNDALLAPYLKVLGFDLDYPIQFIPCQHRNMQGKVVIAYLIAGEVECNAAFLSGPFATMEDRLIAAGYRDLSLADTLAGSMTLGRDYNGDGRQEVFDPALADPQEAAILEQIKVLDDLLVAVRGNPFKNDGNRKTLDEQHTVEPPEKRRRKSVKVAK